MQFASPDWRPPQQRDNQTDVNQSAPYVPQPVNVPPAHHGYAGSGYNQSQSYSPDMEDLSSGAPFEEENRYGVGYRGAHYAVPAQQVRPLPYKRRRNLWPLLMVIILAIALASGGIFNSARSFPFRGDPFHNSKSISGYRQPQFGDEGQTFSGLSAHPTITIANNFGSIHVQTGGQDGTVSLQSDQGQSGYTAIQGKDSLNITANSNDGSSNVLDVTVGNGADLVLTTAGDDINVEGVTGQMNLTSGGGNITLSQDNLTGTSVINSGGGDIGFDGSLDPNGTYQLDSGSGTMTVNLPSNSSYHLYVSGAKVSDSSFTTDLSVPSADQDISSFDLPVGTPPQAILNLTTQGGSINLTNTGP